ncbi:MAG: glycosyltransferase family 4 protein [Nitrospira sp.]|nr:glycosyltransferase family 4 protein [Nitrospira sp.]
MHVSLYANALNLAFLLGVFLRRKGHQVRVFTDQAAADHDRPEWECVDAGELAAVPRVAVDVDVKRWLLGGVRERRFRAQLAEADVVQTFGEGVIWSGGCGAPDTVLSIGDDLDILPFRMDSLRIRVYAQVLRRAQRRCRAVCYTMPPQEDSCRLLGLTNARFLPCAIPIDTAAYRPLSSAERATVRARLGLPSDAFVVFQPSRQEWTCPERPGSNHKGNDRFLRAFARFVKGWGKEAWLLAVMKGRDVERSQALAQALDVDDRVRWIPQQNKTGLRECLGASDVVADQFTYGFYGISTLEAMAVGRPILAHMDGTALEAFGVEAPPVVSVRSEEEIYGALCRLAERREGAEEIGAAARGWMIRHHGWETVVERYLALYKELL